MCFEYTLGSLFDGLGGWQIAAMRAGIQPIWSSEIEKFTCALTKVRFPDTEQLGDITKIDGGTIPPVDIVTMGSPCQDLSISGRREGLKGERSGLFVRAVGLIQQMRTATCGQYPKIAIWENVPGALTSNKGLDFKTVLETVTKDDIPMPRSGKWAKSGMVRGRKCNIVWRILDARFWGVPQRRRRIFLVVDYTKRYTGEILFKPESMPRHIKTGKRAQREARQQADECFEKAVSFDMTHANDVIGENRGSIHIIYARPSYADLKQDATAVTLRASGGCNGGGSENIVCGEMLRKLTPVECERLQGLPDNWTLIDDKSCSDSARYKAIGNGMAQPCADFVMKRVYEFLQNS